MSRPDPKVVFLNGKFLKIVDAAISPMDTGFLRGEGAFETLRSYDGKLPFIDGHYARLRKTLVEMKIRMPLSPVDFKKTVRILLDKNRLQNACVRVTVSRGMLKDGYGRKTTARYPTVFIFAGDIPYDPEKLRRDGVRLRMAKSRKPSISFVASHKTTSYLENMLEKNTALAGRYFDALFTDSTGIYVTECATSNIFLVENRKIYTPSIYGFPILNGITRGTVIEIASDCGIPVYETKIKISKLKTADEIFITNSIAGVLPVCGVNKYFNARGKNFIPGSITKIIMERFKKLTC
ncbi:MAG: aminotransferase class IV [Elusimicrobia bacterium]|nr:aminotransferase class IV [Elusimicrobiota bacterium]